MFLFIVFAVVVVAGMLYINSERKLAKHVKPIGGGSSEEPQTPGKTDTISVASTPKASIIREGRAREQ